jgi:murein DD-endopeptidase MepM/ murein hydrolase activator NlpD
VKDLKRLGYFLTLILFIYSLTGCDNKVQKESTFESQPVVIKKEPLKIYGIAVDSLKVDSGIVKRNEFLADILLKYNVDYAVIDKIAKKTRDIFDVRKIRRGNQYVMITKNDSISKPYYFIYEINKSDFVVYDLKDSLKAYISKKKFEYKEEAIKGIISSSLWNAVIESGGNPNLANSLSEVYAWTIDFFGLQKNDSFKVIYDKLYIEGEPSGIGKIKASLFNHMGDDYYAFYFEQNGEGDYFDEKGNSLERTFLKAPLRYSRISSRFTESRYHPVLKIYRPHHGVDYAAPEGTPVHAVGDGIITKKGYQKRGGGNYLKIKHNSTYTTTYMHLRAFAKGMVVGRHVKQGEIIGYVGHTGLATGPHLDFRFYRNGKAINPLKVKSPPAKPVAKENIPRFDSLVNHYLQILDTIN